MPQGSTTIWPMERLDAAAVREWITAALPGRPTVVGPVEVYRANDYGVTARFAVESGLLADEGVVLKANFLPMMFTAAAPYELLNRCCAGDVPTLLAATEELGRRWMLFRVFGGEPVKTAGGGAAALQRMAAAMGSIQARVAALPETEQARLPRMDAMDLPRLFEQLLLEVRSTYTAMWSANRNKAAGVGEIPDGFVERLERFRPRLHDWAEELKHGRWPDSIDHVDLHANNGVIQPDGHVLIFDWEEAVLGCPFFSIDKLLADAEGAPLPQPLPAAIGRGDNVAAVRSSYLEALPWKTRAERERALDVALCLGPIRYAWEDAVFAEAVGWPVEPVAEVIAWWLTRALCRWEAMQ